MPQHKGKKGGRSIWGCMWCGFTSYSEKARTEHFLKAHARRGSEPAEENRGLGCWYCPERFRTEEGRRLHVEKEHQGILELNQDTK